MKMHRTKGIKLAQLRVTDGGVIQYEASHGWGDIGRVELIKEFHNDPYIDSNGIEIGIEAKIEHLVLTKPQFNNIRKAELSDIDEFTERLGVFNKILTNSLRGVADTTRRTK